MTTAARESDLLRAFEAVLAAAPDERTTLLAALAEQDPESAAHVRRLLDADARNADGFLESPPLGRELTAQALQAPLAAGDERAGALAGIDPAAFKLGRYRGLAVLGLSHHAIVLLAEQTDPVRRLVAVKILRQENAAGDAWARFERERQAVATLTHENIARLYDAGATDAGCPFFVMEYVPGRPLTAFAEEASLSTRDRLRLFAQACRGVEHAHEQGLVHRDLKPGNILAAQRDGERVAKIIDFGVVGARGPAPWAVLTREGCSVGTPLYMSPEQLAGQPADARSDVYSLGVVLYELLAGSLPAPSECAALDETLRRTRRGMLLDDRALGALPPGLRWAVARATDASPPSRYQSVADLRADIERYLESGRVAADPPTRVARVRRYLARRARRIAAVCAAAFLVALACGALAAARHVRAVESELETFRAELAAVLTEEPVEVLSDIPSVHSVRRAQLDRLEAIAESLSRREGSDPEILAATAEILTAQAALDEEAGMLGQAAERLDRALVIRQRLARQRPNDPEAARLLSLAIVRVGDLTKHLGDLAGGIRLYEQAFEIDKRLVQRHPDNERLRLTLAWSFERIAYVDAANGDLDTAERGHHDQLAATGSIAGSEAERCRAAAHVHLSVIGLKRSDPQAGREHAELAVTHARSAVRENPASRAAQISLCTAVAHRGNVEVELGDHRAALAVYERALDLDLLSLTIPDPMLLRNHASLCYHASQLALALGEDEKQERFIAAAIQIYERVLSLAPSDADALAMLAMLRLDLAGNARRRGDDARANDLTRKGIQTWREAPALARDTPAYSLALARALLLVEPERFRDPREALRLLGQIPSDCPQAEEAATLRTLATEMLAPTGP